MSEYGNFVVTGSLSVVADPAGNPGNVNVAGPLNVTGSTVLASSLNVSGATVLASNLTVSGTQSITGATVLGSNLTVSGTESVSGIVQIGSNGSIVSPMPAGSATNQVQILGTSSAGISQTITMSGSGRIVPISFTNTSTVSIGLTPTLSTSTGGNFQDGSEITILNISPSGTNLVVPSSLMGSISNAGIVTVSAMRGVRFVYSALLQSWLPAGSN